MILMNCETGERLYKVLLSYFWTVVSVVLFWSENRKTCQHGCPALFLICLWWKRAPLVVTCFLSFLHSVGALLSLHIMLFINCNNFHIIQMPGTD